MIWVEIVCDGCSTDPFGEMYTSNSISKMKKKTKEAGWKTINEKIYCPECQEKMKR